MKKFLHLISKAEISDISEKKKHYYPWCTLSAFALSLQSYCLLKTPEGMGKPYSGMTMNNSSLITHNP